MVVMAPPSSYLVADKITRPQYLVNDKFEAETGATVADRPYHHGNLRRALLDAALAEIAAHGPVALSLRGLARHAGVSHAAPAHHFGDKTGLLTAIATEGFTLLGEALRAARAAGGFLDVGVAYIEFAVSHPAHFEVMYRPDLYRPDDPELETARAETTRLLYGSAADAFPDDDAARVGIAGWAFAHGFAELWRTGNLQPRLGDDAMAAARRVAPALFAPVPQR
jgi:AcrR family transcriptional regulator